METDDWVGPALFALAIGIGLITMSGIAYATLLNVRPTFPVLTDDQQGVLTYDAVSDSLSIDAEAIANVATKHRIVFTIMRGGLMRQVVLDFSRDYEKE